MAQATGGGGGKSAYNNQVVSLLKGSTTSVSPYVQVTYTSASQSGSGTQITTKTTISGSKTDRLTLNSDRVGIQTVRAVVKHPSSCLNEYQAGPIIYSDDQDKANGTFDGGLTSNTADFESISAANLSRSILKYELVNEASSDFISDEQNLFTNSLNFRTDLPDAGDVSETGVAAIVFYAPEEDITVKITMAGSAGQGFNGRSGGSGGACIFTHTLTQNTEYVVKLGGTIEPSSSIGRGGAGAYLYEKGRLLVACGGGGASGWSGGNGGDGGGAGVAGAPGSGSGGGAGGQKVNAGQLSSVGQLPQGTAGGNIESCTTGIYWARNGYAPCQDIGTTVQWYDFDGDVTPNTANINRGYKSSNESLYGYRNNGGNSSTSVNGIFVGGGGSGATGGSATTNSKGGGGGGSGYTSGAVNILQTQQGGNSSSRAFITIELL